MAAVDSDVDTRLAEIIALEKTVEELGNSIRALKASKAPKDQIEAEVEKLKDLKAKLALAKKTEKPKFDRQHFEETLKRRFFYAPSFQIYNGVAGLYDYGPPGCSIKANFLSLWREHFVIEEGMLEVDCTNVTPYAVLKTSGHVDKFAARTFFWCTFFLLKRRVQDLMVKDVQTGECFRADKLLEEHLGKLSETATEAKREEYRKVIAMADAFTKEEIYAKMQEYGVKSPDTGNDLSEPFPFNLMFQTQIGPRGDTPGFLRPETAQGIFVNFKKLLDFNGARLPFAAAQIGKAFRNEIAPRSGLLRVREFEMCEIEHFVRGDDKSYHKFGLVREVTLTLFGRDGQMGDGKCVQMTVGDAVAQGVINNETLGYFMARTFLLLCKIGVKAERIRFRQHLANEMAHYACDCWDAELHTSYGWIECVGHADRACYDLSVHSAATKVDLTAYEDYATPKLKEVLTAVMNKGVLGKTLRQDAKKVTDYLEKIGEIDIEAAGVLAAKLEAEGSAVINVEGADFTITKDQVSFKKETKKIHGRNYHPGVIEPSFGVGRIIYSLLEQVFWCREGDEQRVVLSLPPCIAPFKVSVLPLSGHSDLTPFVPELDRLLRGAAISCRVDDSSAAIGRRYSRMDELGIPFAVTIDFDTKTDKTVTVRERDSTTQVRIPIASLVDTLRQLISGDKSWDQIRADFPNVAVAEE